MKFRLLILLVLMVVVPLAVLGWLGVRLDASQRVEQVRAIDEMLLEELRNYDERITLVLLRHAIQFEADLAAVEADAATLRDMSRRSPFVNQFFALDENGVLRYPALNSDVTEQEESFLLRTREIWLNGELMTQGDAEQVSRPPGKVSPVAQTTKGGKSAFSNTALVRREAGWYVWHWGNDVHLIYWLKRDDGIVVGGELNGARLKADIIAALPDTVDGGVIREVQIEEWVLGASELLSLTRTRTELRNSHGEPIYVWDNQLASPKSKDKVTLALSYPLSNWSLAFCVDPSEAATESAPGFFFRLSTRLGALAVVLIGIAIFFYRESAREMRVAAQRVTFVNQVSHELKTPLTNIRMYAEMLDQNLEDADEQSKRHIGVLVSESQRLSRLIANILSFNRKDRKALTLRRSTGVVDASIRAVLAQFAPALEAKGIGVKLELHAETPLQFDADAVEQIVGNLVSNVEKYAADGKALGVWSRIEGERVTIEVADHGPGIPVKARKKIFEAFFRVSDRLTDGVAGTGIGLTIARELARLHGGDLTLIETERGARFRVTLHCPPAPQGVSV